MFCETEKYKNHYEWFVYEGKARFMVFTDPWLSSYKTRFWLPGIVRYLLLKTLYFWK